MTKFFKPFIDMSVWGDSILLFGMCLLALTFIVMIICVINIKCKIRRNRKMIAELDAKAAAVDEKLALLQKGQTAVLDLLTNGTIADSVEKANQKIKTQFDSKFGELENFLEMLILQKFPTREDKIKSQIFDKLGAIFNSATGNPEKLGRVVDDYDLDNNKEDNIKF